MVGERIIPGGAALEAFHDLGSDNWDTDWNTNLLKVAGGLTSVLVVKSQVTTLPGTPVLGDIYIVKDGDANEKQIAIWDGPVASEVWNYFPAFEGLKASPMDTKDELLFDGTNWVLASGGVRRLLTVGVATPFSVPSSTNTIFVPDLEVRDTEGLYDVGTNPSRIPALGNGLHRIHVHMDWDAIPAAILAQHLFTLNRAGSTAWNNDLPDLLMETIQASGGTVSRHLYWSGIADLVLGDYTEILLWQSTGAARDLGVNTHVTMEFLG